MFLLATAYFVVVGRIRHPGREETVWREGHEPPAVEEQAQEQAKDR